MKESYKEEKIYFSFWPLLSIFAPFCKINSAISTFPSSQAIIKAVLDKKNILRLCLHIYISSNVNDIRLKDPFKITYSLLFATALTSASAAIMLCNCEKSCSSTALINCSERPICVTETIF